MFDTVHRHQHTHVENRGPSRIDVTVKEHRAPTDESVKLLRELEDKALQSILSTIKLESTPFDCRVFPMLTPMSESIKFVVLYKIGKLHPLGRQWDAEDMQRLEHVAPIWDKPSPEKIVDSLLLAVATDVAKTMLQGSAEKLTQSLRALPIKF